MDTKELRNLQDAYYKSSIAYHSALNAFYDQLLKEGDYIDFGDDCPVVTYDGGNHAEYASTLNCVCYGFGKKNGRVYFNLEDDCEYDIDRMDYDDLDIMVSYLAPMFKFFW